MRNRSHYCNVTRTLFLEYVNFGLDSEKHLEIAAVDKFLLGLKSIDRDIGN